MCASLKLGREQETVADLTGLQLPQRAKIDPSGMITFFERLSEKDESWMECGDQSVIEQLEQIASVTAVQPFSVNTLAWQFPSVVHRVHARICEVPSEGMRKMIRRIGSVLCLTVMGIVFTSCTSAVSMGGKGGLDQKIRITSDPPGAQVFLMGSIPLGETPLLDVKIERTPNTFLTLKKEGYVDQNLLLKYHYHVVLNPRKASREQREQVVRMKTVRNLTLIGYLEVQQNLAVGHGEYLASLLVTLRVPESEQGNAVRQLQELIADSADPLDFSDKVLDRFHVSRFW